MQPRWGKDGGPSHSRFFVRIFFVFLIACTLIGTGCTRLPQGSKPSQAQKGLDGPAENVVDALNKNADLAACRGVLSQLNAQAALNAERAVPILSDADKQALKKQFLLDDDELVEITSTSYTPLDAHHLESALFFAEIARSLDIDALPPLARAQIAFNWVMRQVQLQESNDNPWPAEFVLRRGWGTHLERVAVFLALLRQLDIPGCMFAVPPAVRPFPGYAIAGVIVDGEVYLFETRLGIAIPGASGQDPATLGKARTDAAIWENLNVSPALPYDVTKTIAQRAKCYLYGALSDLAPRMRVLEKTLPAGRHASLGVDPHELPKTLAPAVAKGATGGDDLGFWIKPAETITPFRSLRLFLAPEEGGTDTTTWRRRQFELTLTPWDSFPAPANEIGENLNIGRVLRMLYENQFLDFRKIRDLMLRGRFDEAIADLTQNLEIARHQQSLVRAEPQLQGEFVAWCQELMKAQEDVLLLQRKAGASKTAEDAVAVQDARQRLNAIWTKGEGSEPGGPSQPEANPDEKPATRPPPLLYLVGSAAVARETEALYLLAVVKHEQAEFAQRRLDRLTEKSANETKSVRAAWSAAAEWWKKFMDQNAAAAANPSARLGRSHALEALGERDAAFSLLENPPAAITGWNRNALLFAARQLKNR